MARFHMFGGSSLFLLLLGIFYIFVSALAFVVPFLTILFKGMFIRFPDVCMDHLWYKNVFSFFISTLLFCSIIFYLRTIPIWLAGCLSVVCIGHSFFLGYIVR